MENQTATNPQSVDEPSIIPSDEAAPQSEAGDSTQSGGAESDVTGGADAQGTPEPPKWVHQLTGELKSDERVTQHQNLNDLVSEYLQYAGKTDRLVELPGDDADDESWNQFVSKIRPENPDDYRLPDLDGVDTGQFRRMAHEQGLTQRQAAALQKQLSDSEVSRSNLVKQDRAERHKQLKQEWGDSFNSRVHEAQTAFAQIAKTLGDNELIPRIQKTGFGSDPDVMRVFYGIWQMIKPDTLVEGSIDGDKGTSVAETYYPETNFDS